MEYFQKYWTEKKEFSGIMALFLAMAAVSVHFFTPRGLQAYAILCAVNLAAFLLCVRLQKKYARCRRNRDAIEALMNEVVCGFAVYKLDRAFDLLYASDAYYALIGYTPEEFAREFGGSGLSFMGTELLLDHLGKCSGGHTAVRLEFPLIKKDGAQLWVRANCKRTRRASGCDTLSYLLMDITDSKRNEEALLMEKERYHIATELTNDIIFEYDIQADRMSRAEKYTVLFGRPALTEDYLKQKCRFDWIAGSTRDAFEALCRDFSGGKPTMSAEIKLLDKERQYTWCHIKGKTIYSDSGRPQKVIGKIVNINAQKHALEALYQKACRDSLTELYNKMITKTMIDKILRADSRARHALLIIDIDNFKAVNDHFGHLVGDEVLVNVSAQLKTLFGKGDIIGRIGGDEFVVFMHSVQSTDEVVKKANTLSHALRETYQLQDKTCMVSSSIGIALFPENGESYAALLASADATLYQVKNMGKNNFAFSERVAAGKDVQIG